MNPIKSFLAFVFILSVIAIGFWVNPYYAVVYAAIVILIVLLWRTTF